MTSTLAKSASAESSEIHQRDAARSQDSTKQLWIFWTGLLLASLPFVLPYMRSLWRQELYQYFPFVLIGVGYLFYVRWDGQLRAVDGKFVWFLTALGCAGLVSGALLHSTWLGSVGFLLLLTSFLATHQSQSGNSLLYLAMPLVMFVRIPQLHAYSIVSRLQKITSQLASLCLDLLAVPQDTFGNAIKLPTKNLFVAEACSGIQSAFTMCFLALLLLVWKRRPLVATPVYIAVALGLAIIANIVRVLIIVLAEAWYTYDLTSGWLHDLVGYISLSVAAGFLLSFDIFSGAILHPVDVVESQAGVNPFAYLWNLSIGASSNRDFESEDWKSNSGEAISKTPLVFGIPKASVLLLAVAFLAGLGILGGFATGRSDTRPIAEKDAVLFDPPAEFLEGSFGVLTVGGHEVSRNGSDPQLGIHADTWVCHSGRVAGQVVMSQPFVGWHELCVCYEVQDWELTERYNLEVNLGEPIAVGKFKKGTQYGYLFFAAIDSDGDTPTPPSYTLFGRIIAPFGPLITDDFAETSGSAQTIMIQFWAVAEEELPPDQIREIGTSLAEMRDQVSDSVVQSN